MADDVLLMSWVQLSDVHHSRSGGADSADRALVLAELRRDIEGERTKGKVPAPRIVLVTGDVAATGDEPEPGKSGGEYAAAAAWLDAVAKSLSLCREDVLIVAGNHDVQRAQDKDLDVARMMSALRKGDEHLDDVLDRPIDRAKLVRRQRNYLDFVATFGPPETHTPADAPWWSVELPTTDAAIPLRLIGLNTALLARDNDDLGALRLGAHQLGPLVFGHSRDGLTIVLTHHPLHGSWLRDEGEAIAWFKNNVDAHLSGHIHSPSSEDRRSGSGLGFVAVSAGAVHAGAPGSHLRRTHSYNFAGLYRLSDGRIVLRVWHRRWSVPNASFRVDIDNVGPDDFAEHEIRRPKTTSANPATPPGTSNSAMYPDPIDLATASALDAASMIQEQTGVRVEVLVDTHDAVILWVKPVYQQMDERKRLLLRLACLLAGRATTKTILIGFADTSRLRNGVGEDTFLTMQVALPADAVRVIAQGKVVAPNFWSAVRVTFWQTPISPFATSVTKEFPDFEAGVS